MPHASTTRRLKKLGFLWRPQDSLPTSVSCLDNYTETLHLLNLICAPILYHRVGKSANVDREAGLKNHRLWFGTHLEEEVTSAQNLSARSQNNITKIAKPKFGIFTELVNAMGACAEPQRLAFWRLEI